MFSAFIHGVRCLIWVPFAVASSLSTLVLINVVVYLFYQPFWMVTFWWSIILCGLAMPLEHTLRPAPREPKLHRPADKAIVPQLARFLLRDKGQAPSLVHARQALPKELRALLAAPITRPPEAVIHGQEMAKQLSAPADRRAV